VDGSAAGQLLRGFETYLLEERGIKEVGRYLYLVRPFLGGLGLSDVSTLKELSAKAVSDFIVREGRSSSVGHLKLKATALRAFLRYLHVRGLCRDLSGAIPRVSGYRLAGLPRAVPEETLRRIESSCDRNTVTGRRDYAILLLLSRLGLRAGEVAALELDDVRWIQGEIVVRGKGTEGVLPLPQDVGDALVDYLKVGRPTSTSRKVFLAMNAPRRELTASAVRHVVRGACQRAGLPPIGSHRLRHSAATLMLRRGASLPEVGQVLRHRRLTSTAIYAKVDYRALRSVSRAWPGGAA
jgi:site-specific recombinase XerD